MPIAFVVSPYKEPYEELYNSVVKPQLEAHGFDVTRADEVPASTNVVADIEKYILESDLVLIDVSEHNPNVYWEFGLAVAADKEFIIIAKKGSDLPFNTGGWRHLLYDPEDSEDLVGQLSLWLTRTTAYRELQDRQQVATLTRGEVFSDFFDSTSIVDDISRLTEEKIRGELLTGSLIPTRYAYMTERGTRHWLAICRDHTYHPYQDSITFLSKRSAELLESIGSTFLSTSPDVISLGPGNGYKDTLLLRALMKQIQGGRNSMDLFYYPLDVTS